MSTCLSHLRSRSSRALQSGQHSSLCETPNPLLPYPTLADGEGEGEGEEQYSAVQCQELLWARRSLSRRIELERNRAGDKEAGGRDRNRDEYRIKWSRID